MIGAVAIWYAGGVVIALMVAAEVRQNGKQDTAAARGPGITPLLWLALAAAGLIFALWPWVALNLAENTPL